MSKFFDSIIYEETLRSRFEINLKARKDQDFRKEVLTKCYNDPVYWCNNFAWTYDPRTDVKHLPFVLFPKQVEYLNWLEYLVSNQLDGAIEKSRDMGITYTTLVPFVLYKWLFHEFNAKIGSRVEDYVDKPGDMDTLFEKIAYNLRRMPKWMLPEGFNISEHKTYMKLTRPDNSNTITGESSNPNFARGGRQNIVVFDEHGFWQSARSAWESAGDSTPTRLSISTPPEAGRSSFFYKNLTSGRVQKFTFHYSDDPRKDLQWVADQRSKKSDGEFERELNISYEGSTEGTVYAAQLNACTFDEYEYRPDLPLFIAWDFGLDGTPIQWWQWDTKYDKWYLIESYFNDKEDIEFFIPFITGEIKAGFEYEDDELDMIARHKLWRQDATHYGDPSAEHKRQNADVVADILRKHKIYLQTKPWGGRSHFDMKQKTLLFLKKVCIDSTHNEFYIECMRNARYPKRNEETSQATTGISKPKHDWTSHHRSATEYLADNIPEKMSMGVETSRKAREKIKEYSQPLNELTGY